MRLFTYLINFLGKSHTAWEQASAINPGEQPYVKAPTTKWWDGYRGQKSVIMDEFTGLIELSHLQRWMDKWPCSVEIKGGTTSLHATKFWICSNVDPDAWYPNATPEQRASLRRRFTRVVRYELPFGPINRE